MKYEVKDEKNCKKVISISLDKTDTGETYREIVKKFRDEASIDGYRKGKAPEEMVVSRYKDKIKEEVSNKVIPQKGSQAIQELGLHVVSYPSIQNVKENDGAVDFDIIVETSPEFKLGEFKDIKIKKKELKEITDKDVEREINRVRQAKGSLKETSRDTVKEGDYANFSMVGFVDNKAEPELAGDNELVQVGRKMVPEDLDKGLAGMKTGEEKEIDVRFPDDYFNKKFTGKKAVIKVTMKAIKELELPKLDDEFVKSLGGEFKTVEELKNAVKDNLAKQAQSDVRGSNLDMIFRELLKRNEFEVAAGLVEQEINNLVSRYENNLRQQGLSVEKLGIDKNTLREKNRKQAEENVRLRYILREVGKTENVEVKDEDLEAEIKKVADTTKEDYDALLKRAKANWDALKFQLFEDRVIEKLLSMV